MHIFRVVKIRFWSSQAVEKSVSQKQAGGFRSSDQAAALDNREHWGQSKGNIQAENTEITENTGVKGNVQASRSIIITKEAISVSKQLSADIVDMVNIVDMAA